MGPLRCICRCPNVSLYPPIVPHKTALTPFCYRGTNERAETFNSTKSMCLRCTKARDHSNFYDAIVRGCRTRCPVLSGPASGIAVIHEHPPGWPFAYPLLLLHVGPLRMTYVFSRGGTAYCPDGVHHPWSPSTLRVLSSVCQVGNDFCSAKGVE